MARLPHLSAVQGKPEARKRGVYRHTVVEQRAQERRKLAFCLDEHGAEEAAGRNADWKARRRNVPSAEVV